MSDDCFGGREEMVARYKAAKAELVKVERRAEEAEAENARLREIIKAMDSLATRAREMLETLL